MSEIIIYKLETFFFLIVLGVIAARTGILKKDNLPVLSRILSGIAFPCLGFSLIYDAGMSLVDLFSIRTFLAAELLLSASLLVLGLASAGLFRLPDKIWQIHVIQTAFGNQGFMNIPILLALYAAGEASSYIALFTFTDQLLLWSLGVLVLSSGSGESTDFSPKESIRKILNPMNLAMIAAVILVSLDISLPESFSETITGTGEVSFSLALVFLGASLSYVSLKNIDYIRSYVFLVLVKMLIIPICAALIAARFLTDTETTILTLMAGMPGMSAIPMMASTYGSDPGFASRTVLVMTVCSAVTLPLVMTMLTLIQGG